MFRTDMFPDESEAIEQGKYPMAGRFLAEWLSQQLPKYGIEPGVCSDEDWGWYVTLEGNHALIMVACGEVEGETDQYQCFTKELGRFDRFMMRKKGKPGMHPEVVLAIDTILKSEPRIRNIEWIDQSSDDPNASYTTPFDSSEENPQ